MALTTTEITTLEAFADTVLPGRKRHENDRAIAGVSPLPGAVEAGALTVLQDPATGIDDGIAEMAHLLNEHAREHAARIGVEVGDDVPFADLDYQARRGLVADLSAPDAALRDFWFLLALFSYMAYDSAPHRDTATAIAEEHPGLLAVGFARPDENGHWGFERASYRQPMARLHPDTDENGHLP
ncbi:DUF5987 family protein [Nocardia sp. CNY236]|uniref:DUF5987 family protein n=1 Tax=Nocardia sp. CNY236 TaxID=1169152 RepID=UPI0018CA1B76|nr:DUF5987 family protein [Nocardia sp. CNY236]